MAQSRARIKSVVENLRKSKEKPPGINQQTQSPLFNLPLELRDKIWSFALSPSETTRARDRPAAHFHIYDTVYDGCTYIEVDSAYKARRRNLVQMSLLLTCRAAYTEALKFLYEDTDFTLVLFAGRPRPNDCFDNLSARNCIGTIEECKTFFTRMRKVTLVIQPGKQPDAEKYAARVEELLTAMDYCRKVKELCLHFAFRSIILSYDDGEERFQTIVRAFYALNKREGDLLIQTSALWGHISPVERFKDLHAAIPGSRVSPWWHIERRNQCLTRGTDGQIHHPGIPRSLMTRRQKAQDAVWFVSVIGIYLALSPITLPLSYWGWRKRKLDKGER